MWLSWGNIQPRTVTGSSELPALSLSPFFFGGGGLEVETCRFDLELVTITGYHLLCYMRQICGLQCFDNLGRKSAVLTVQKRAVDNFTVEQGSWKADIHSSSQEIPNFNAKWTFISHWKVPATEGHCDIPWLYLHVYIYIVSHPSRKCKCYCCRSSKFSFHLVIKQFLSFCIWVFLCQSVKVIVPCTRTVWKVSVLIFLWTNLKCSTLLRHTSA
jgi:hypothetical protein